MEDVPRRGVASVTISIVLSFLYFVRLSVVCGVAHSHLLLSQDSSNSVHTSRHIGIHIEVRTAFTPTNYQDGQLSNINGRWLDIG
jgi:hypothetical protein